MSASRKSSRIEQQSVARKDESFNSNESLTEIPNDIRYDPYKEGCQRPGLRVRRFRKPWWTYSKEAENYGVLFVTSLSHKEILAEIMLEKLLKKNHARQSQKLNCFEIFLKPSEKLKIVEAQKKPSKASEQKEIICKSPNSKSESTNAE